MLDDKLRFRIGLSSLIAGMVLVAEHVISKGFLTWEIFGHETLGAALAIVGYILCARKKG